MTARILDGKSMADKMKLKIKEQVEVFIKQHFQPKLSVILVGDDPASHLYVRKKQEACAEVGIKSEVITNITNPNDLLLRLKVLNSDPDTHGILIQLPLPKEYEESLNEILESISPVKDVDVFNSSNIGLLVKGTPRFLPCTPRAVQHLIYDNGLDFYRKHVCVISRSNVVGKPLSSMLIQDNVYANATVTICHDNTPPEKLIQITKSVDVIVVAVGIPGFLKTEHVSPGQIVVDVGTTKVDGKIRGDVDSAVYEVVKWVSKPIGGVGPLTIVSLLANTLTAARLQA